MTGTAAELRRLLDRTTLPTTLVEDLVRDAPDLWLTSNSSSVLAADLALCHPALGPSEVRARGVPFVHRSSWRLTVVAHDRPGLLADTAGALASAGHSVTMASVATWSDLDIALHSLTVAGPLPDGETLDAIGRSLRRPPAFEYHPAGGGSVSWVDAGFGRSLLTIAATDQNGLLWAICNWLAGQGVSIEAAGMQSEGNEAHGVLLVHVDAAAGDGAARPIEVDALSALL